MLLKPRYTLPLLLLLLLPLLLLYHPSTNTPHETPSTRYWRVYKSVLARKKMEESRNKYVSFKVCNGYTNQLLSILDGMIIGYILNLKIILPKLYSNYDLVEADIKYQDIFDVEYLYNRLNSTLLIDMEIHNTPYFNTISTFKWRSNIERLQITRDEILLNFEELMNDELFLMKWLNNDPMIIEMDCAFLSLNIKDDADLIELRWKIFNALRVNKPIYDFIDKSLKNVGEFNGFHLRLEDDWMEHCKVWVGLNCDMFSKSTIDGHSYLYRMLQANNIDTKVPLYIATALSEPELRANPLLTEIFSNYNVILKGQMINLEEQKKFIKNGSKSREILAAIDFFIMQRSNVFIGNSVSTFSAMHMIHRKQLGQQYVLYNGGNIPLEPIMFNQKIIDRPHGRLAWVITIDGTFITDFDMAKASIISAKLNTNLLIFCIYGGKQNEFTSWLESNGVIIFYHKLSFQKKLTEKFLALGLDTETVHNIVNQFAFLDIPILGFTDEFLLVTNAHVLFFRNITLDDFLPLPPFLSCGYPDKRPNERAPTCLPGLLLLRTIEIATQQKQMIDFLLNYKFVVSEASNFGNLFYYELFFEEYFGTKITFVNKLLNWLPHFAGWNSKPKIVRFTEYKIESLIMLYNKTIQINENFHTDLLNCYLPYSSCEPIYKSYLTYTASN